MENKFLNRKSLKKIFLFGILLFLLIEYFSIPSYSIQLLKNKNPGKTALMRQRIKESDGKIKINQRWVSLTRISPHLIHAIIVAEDGTFFEHGGIDWYEVQESIEKNIEEGRAARGASTITQQLAKNLYLSTSKDPLRKIKELIITLRMERYLKKNRILEIYLNVIEFGEGIFGVESAARKYFGKSSAELDRYESARLAAIIPSPLKHSPVENSRWLNYRTNIILNRMEARGW
ncbi:MAG: Monofunctional biosynthetic peptidoglycan transglycosylase [Ignavibacteriae bacterium]|nr:MAG: Monofunctional biosynthetic peptidoglycan transglycosylase [Ignavibacteriota bacterium]